MKQLNYSVLKESGYKGFILKTAPEKVLQFGEGNFLRAFVDYWFDIANEKAGWNGKCVIVQPISSSGPNSVVDMLNEQECLYTLYLRGSVRGERVDSKRVISSVSRALNPVDKKEDFDALMELAVSSDLELVVSNTTEAGIAFDSNCKLEDAPASSYPGKLTQILYKRWKAGKSALVILPCELIDNNGAELQKCVLKYVDLWKLENAFKNYIEKEWTFCSTLVDRIVPGAIRNPEEVECLQKKNGYIDKVMDVGEIFGVWNIEGPDWLEEKLPFKAAGVNCPVVPDVTPYKKRKVRILNGAHTSFVPGAYLAGFDIVRDAVSNNVICSFMNKLLYEEVIPTLPLNKKDLMEFASSVQDRFNNPFINHALIDITLNSTSKWRTRVMPSLVEYVSEQKELPICITMSMAALIAFFSNDIQELNEKSLICRRPKGDSYACKDEYQFLKFYFEHKNDSTDDLVRAVLTNENMWGRDLSQIRGFESAVISDLERIRTEGSELAFASCLS